MQRGLYIAATGMLSDVARQDAIASNLANVNTVGYKSDRVVNETFSELFLQNMKNGRDVGSLNLGTRVSGIVTDFAQGAMRPTQQQLDVAIAGDGFFTVQTPQGLRYTRDGQFSRDAQGYLVTKTGAPVLNTGGQPIYIGSGDPTIDGYGRVFANGTLVGALNIATLDMNSARKMGENFWTADTVTNGLPANSALRQGFVEASGVNSVKEMIEMIRTLRSYESSQKIITSIDGTLDKAVNSVGVVS